MKQIKQPGFTIIEVVLFLAVSGLLAVGLMVGTGAAIQRQQYRDAVQSYANFLRDQYARVVAVENDRTEGACPLGSEGTTQRGRSSCVVVGRYMETPGVVGGRTSYATHPLYAVKNGDIWRYGYSATSDEQYATNWDAKTRLASGDAAFSLVMYRDPEIGTLAIRVSDQQYSAAEVQGFITGTETSAEDSVEICVYETGWLAGERQSVFVSTVAGSGDAITVGSASARCADA